MNDETKFESLRPGEEPDKARKTFKNRIPEGFEEFRKKLKDRLNKLLEGDDAMDIYEKIGEFAKLIDKKYGKERTANYVLRHILSLSGTFTDMYQYNENLVYDDFAENYSVEKFLFADPEEWDKIIANLEAEQAEDK